jgi:hypothetical protein
LFANIAIAWIVGWILFMSVWYILLSFLWAGFLYVFGVFVYFPVEYIISVSRYFGGWWVLDIPENTWALIILIFLAFFVSEVMRLDRLPDLSRRMHDHSHQSDSV